MKRLSSAVFIAMFVGACISAAGQQPLRYNYTYACKEKIVVGHCRSDSDQFGWPRTRPENDYCQVYYPDRPKTGGFDAMGAVLRADLIRTLTACGAFKEAAVADAARTNAGTADGFYQLGRQQYSAGHFADAAESFKRSIALDPSTAAWTNLGNCYGRLGQFANAVTAEEEALKLKPDNATAAANLGAFYIAVKRYDEAVKILLDVRKADPRAARPPADLGEAYFLLKKYPEAAAQLQDAIKLSPEDMTLRVNLGVAYFAMGRKDLAMRQYNELKSLDPKAAESLMAEIGGK